MPRPAPAPPPLPTRLRFDALLQRLSGLRKLQRVRAAILRETDATNAQSVLRGALRWLDLTLDLPSGELDRIPASGPLLVVANHPTGAMEGILLLALLQSVRTDVRVLANQELLAAVPELADLVLPVDLDAPGSNTTAMRAAVRHLRAGHCLLVFPAGEVASRRRPWSPVREAAWHAGVAGMQRLGAATVVPVHVRARTPWWFHAAGMLHPALRTALLPRALSAQQGRSVALRIGQPIPANQLQRFGGDRDRVDYLRLRTEILDRRQSNSLPTPHRRPHAPLAAPVPRERLEADVERLPRSAELLRSGTMRVLVARAAALPNVLPEIGRLRELTFRGVGEGSGLERDLDAFDRDYLHLFVWDESRGTIVGAYRLGLVDELLRRGGPQALYTASLYRYRAPFLEHVRDGVELGRSFVQPDYQKAYLPLFLLWRGIGAFVARDPIRRQLFGTVSISADHHATSVALMVDHLRAHCTDRRLGDHVVPRRPWRRRSGTPAYGSHLVADLRDVAAMVREIETRHQGVPILLEQYLRLGARVAGINVDPAFHTIDALVVVDMLRAPANLQERYLGADGAVALRRWHTGEGTPVSA